MPITIGLPLTKELKFPANKIALRPITIINSTIT